MPFVLIRHKVQDFAKWKSAYDADAPVRQKAGLRDKALLRNADNPQEVVILFETDDLAAARQFTAAPQLREVMEKAGVIDQPTMFFLENA